MTGRVRVPDGLAASLSEWLGDAGRAWADGLPALAETVMERWSLRPDGPAAHGAVGLVLPVTGADGTPGALKLQPVDEETRGEPLALRTWNGRGAVRLLAHDADSGAMLLERLDPGCSLESVEDDLAALRILAGLLAGLSAVPAPPGLRTLADLADGILAAAPRALAALADPDDRRLLADCAAALREVRPEPGDRLLHWDLHYGNVLAPPRGGPGRRGISGGRGASGGRGVSGGRGISGSSRIGDPDGRGAGAGFAAAAGPVAGSGSGSGRGDWLAIDPKPLAGDPGFELLPALRNRWSDLVAAGDVPRALRRRFDLMTDVLAIDRPRATAWTLARVLQNSLWDIEDGATTLDPHQRAIAETLHPGRV
ncbi:aminoglycoside phosphotransferase family protein [Kitasatospora sp. NPDC004240]